MSLKKIALGWKVKEKIGDIIFVNPRGNKDKQIKKSKLERL